MKEKIVLYLKTRLPGVAESYLNGIAESMVKTITDEKQIETTFTDGVIDLLKLTASQLQVEGDKRATSAAQTALDNFRKKHNLDENGKPIEAEPGKKKKKVKDDDDESDDVPQWALDLQKANEELRKKLELQELEKTSSVLIDKVKKHEKLKDIPASFLKGRNLIPKSEAEIDQLVADLRTDYDTFYQEQVEAGVIVSIPKSSNEGTKEGEKLGKDAAEKRNKNVSEGVKAKALN